MYVDGALFWILHLHPTSIRWSNTDDLNIYFPFVGVDVRLRISLALFSSLLWMQTSHLYSFGKWSCPRARKHACANARQSACESRRKSWSDLGNANSSPPLECSVAWQWGREKKPHKASPTKLHFLFSSLPPSLHGHTDPILSACLFVARLIFQVSRILCALMWHPVVSQ